MKDYTIYVTEDIAKKAIEKGFECKIMNYSADLFYKEFPPHFHDSYNNYFLPTAEQICGWLREEFGIIINDSYFFNMVSDTPCFEDNVFEWDIEWPTKYTDRCADYGYKSTYKEAMLEGINKALDLI